MRTARSHTTILPLGTHGSVDTLLAAYRIWVSRVLACS